ncbi:MAG: hypothetical protein ABIK92_04595 [Pseudomonadota bacterium]
MWNNEIIIIKEGQFITGRDKLAKETGINRSSVDRLLKFLENEHQIEQQMTTKFRLITVINWKEYQCTEQQSEQQVSNKRATSEHKQECKNDKNEKNIISSEQGSQVNKVINVFKGINPMINWGNKTIRKSASDLIKRFGLDATLKMAEQIIAVQGQPYAPVCTTPHQMKEKLAQFKIYFDSKNNKSKIIEV